MNKISENTKITLTLGQLRMLVKESEMDDMKPIYGFILCNEMLGGECFGYLSENREIVKDTAEKVIDAVKHGGDDLTAILDEISYNAPGIVFVSEAGDTLELRDGEYYADIDGEFRPVVVVSRYRGRF